VIKVQELKIQGGYVGGYGNSVPALYEIFWRINWKGDVVRGYRERIDREGQSDPYIF
jgi:hypothetical protein